jgi:class 3 adenylate cyclase
MSDEVEVTLDELSALTGEPPDRLRRWQELGLLPAGAQDRMRAEAIERVRLVQFAIRQGLTEDEIGRVNAEQDDLLANFTEMLGRPRTRIFTFAEAAAVSGTEPELLERIWRAAGLHDQPYAYQDDIEALRWMNGALALGLPEEVVLQMVRVFASSLTRLAEVAVRLFHLHVHERLRAEGLRGAELIATTQAAADPLAELIEPAVLYFHRKAWERAFRDDLVLHLREDTRPITTVPGELVRAIVFADLSSFTPLTEAMGDTVAAQVLERFATLVHDAAALCGGEVVKQIGDAFMIVFRDANSAVRCGLAIERQASSEPMFPAVRLGAHLGPALYREGDYVGVNINLAARVAASAERHQFLTTTAVQERADLPDVVFDPLGPRPLKGIAEEIELFAAYQDAHRPARPADPVCGMELDASAAAGRLNWHGRDLVFCSTQCLRLFIESPHRYNDQSQSGASTS